MTGLTDLGYVEGRNIAFEYRWAQGKLDQLPRVFATIGRDRSDGILFLADPVFFIDLSRVADLIAAGRLPAVSNFVEFARLGGLILKGAKPGAAEVIQ